MLPLCSSVSHTRIANASLHCVHRPAGDTERGAHHVHGPLQGRRPLLQLATRGGQARERTAVPAPQPAGRVRRDGGDVPRGWRPLPRHLVLVPSQAECQRPQQHGVRGEKCGGSAGLLQGRGALSSPLPQPHPARRHPGQGHRQRASRGLLCRSGLVLPAGSAVGEGAVRKRAQLGGREFAEKRDFLRDWSHDGNQKSRDRWNGRPAVACGQLPLRTKGSKQSPFPTLFRSSAELSAVCGCGHPVNQPGQFPESGVLFPAVATGHAIPHGPAPARAWLLRPGAEPPPPQVAHCRPDALPRTARSAVHLELSSGHGAAAQGLPSGLSQVSGFLNSWHNFFFISYKLMAELYGNPA